MRLVRAAAVLGVVALAVLAAVPPAGACSIPLPPSDQQLLDQADLVFEGVALASQDANTTASILSSADPVTWTFSVERVVKGSAAATQQVTTARSGASCGFAFLAGHRYRVYARAGASGFSTSLGSGTRELAATTTTAPRSTPSTTLVARGPLVRTGFPVWTAVIAALLVIVGGAVLARWMRSGVDERG